MRLLDALLALVVVGVALAAQQEAPQKSPGKEPVYEGMPLGHWIEWAKDKDPVLRYEAVRVMAEVGPPAVPTLIGLLKDQHSAICVDAASALGSIGVQAEVIVPALTQLLKDGDAEVRSAAASALEGFGPDAQAAVPALTELLKDKDVSQCATETLGSIGPAAKAAVPALIELLGDEEGRMPAATALGMIGPEAKAAIPDLTGALEDENADFRQCAAEALGKMGPEAEIAVPALAKLLTDDEQEVRDEAFTALQRLGPKAKAAVPALIELVKAKAKDEDSSSRDDASSTLGEIGPEARDAIPVLAEFVNDPDGGPRVVLDIAAIGPAAIPTLAEFLQHKDEAVRRLAAWSLGNIGPEASPAVPALTRLLNDQQRSVREAAVRALGEIGPKAKTAIPALTRSLNDQQRSVREAAVRALGEIGPKAKTAIPALTGLIKDKDQVLRWTAVRVLGQIGPEDKAAAAALTEVLEDKNRDIRDAAAAALGKSTAKSELTEADAKRIRGLIAELAAVDAPDFGFAQTARGSGFAPIPRSDELYGFSRAELGLKRSAAFASLVALGPAAMPLLLESLDDKTPKKLTIPQEWTKNAICLQGELWGNSSNSREAKVLARAGLFGEQTIRHRLVGQYTVKVGDLCFVAVGQITNREYAAVRQPFMPFGFVSGADVNSTVENKEVAAAVRAIWGKSDYRQKLLDSLLLDFQTGNDARAATRLLFYFPDFAEDLILARLDEAEKPDDVLVGAVSWSTSPKLKAKLLEIFRKTADPGTMVAAMPALGKEHDELVFRRLTEQLNALPEPTVWQYDLGYYLFRALGDRFPDRAEKVFRDYLKPGTVGRRTTVILVLRATCGDLAIPLLGPLLDDKREFVPVVRSGYNPPTRVCYEAAQTIAMRSKTLTFDAKGTAEDSDEQIEVMRRKIAEMKATK